MTRFVKIPLDVLGRTDLTASAKIVYAVLVNRISDNGIAWPSRDRLAKECGLAGSTVSDAVDRLARAGLIEVIRAGCNPNRATNRYRIPTGRNSDGSKSKRRRVGNPLPTGRNSDVEETKRKDQVEKTKKSAPDPSEEAIQHLTGDTLRTDSFRRAWRDWTTYRREIKKPLTPSTIKAQIRKLETWGHDGAIRAIEQSVANGWAGLFEPREDDNGRKRIQASRGDQAIGRHQSRRLPELAETIVPRDYVPPAQG